MQLMPQQEIMPFVRFETRAVQDHHKSIEEGMPVYRNEDFIILMQRGSRDEYTKQADEFFAQKKAECGRGTYNQDWYRAFLSQYEDFKAGREASHDGLPLTMWPGITPAEIEMAKAAQCYTVQHLAELAEEGMARFMGARALRDKARAYLAAAKDAGKVSEENAALRVLAEQQGEQIKDLLSRLAALERDAEAKRGPGRPRKYPQEEAA